MGDYQHVVDLCCPDCHPDPIETVLLYQLDGYGRIASVKCKNCGKAEKPRYSMSESTETVEDWKMVAFGVTLVAVMLALWNVQMVMV